MRPFCCSVSGEQRETHRYCFGRKAALGRRQGAPPTLAGMTYAFSARRHPYAGADDPHGLPPVRDDLPPKLRWAWSMARHLARARFPVETPLKQLVVATVLRSVETFTAVLELLEYEQPAQAGVLARPLFEDPASFPIGSFTTRLIPIGWWNGSSGTATRLRSIKSASKEKQAGRSAHSCQVETSYGHGKMSSSGSSAAKLERDWWDPGENGRGEGRPIGVRGVCSVLEDAAERGEMFRPRLAGGRSRYSADWSVPRLSGFTSFSITLPPACRRSRCPTQVRSVLPIQVTRSYSSVGG